MEKQDKNLSSIQKAFLLLDCFSEQNKPMSLQELSDTLTYPKSTVHHILSELRRQQVIEQEPETGKYYMGIRLFNLGNAIRKSLDIFDVATPYMRQLCNTAHESVHLTKLSCLKLTIIHKFEPAENPLRIVLNIGVDMPMHATSHGKVTLAHLSEYQVKAILDNSPLKSFTAKTITSADKLMRQLVEIRARSYAVDDGERHIGLHSVASPVFDGSGSVVYGVGCVGMFNSVENPRFAVAIQTTVETAAKISSKLGYRKPWSEVRTGSKP
ncbi:MAG: IclR family transcriptional regulator [Synergistaceae bacterium]|nr:IclR family transcriptional regulator [Synergistaceae bacterium]